MHEKYIYTYTLIHVAEMVEQLDAMFGVKIGWF